MLGQFPMCSRQAQLMLVTTHGFYHPRRHFTSYRPHCLVSFGSKVSLRLICVTHRALETHLQHTHTVMRVQACLIAGKDKYSRYNKSQNVILYFPIYNFNWLVQWSFMKSVLLYHQTIKGIPSRIFIKYNGQDIFVFLS